MDSIKHRLPASITTDRLDLTTPTLAHVPEMAVLANSKAIYQVLSRLPHPYDESHGRDFVENIARGETEFAWAILRDGHYIGTIGLHHLAALGEPRPPVRLRETTPLVAVDVRLDQPDTVDDVGLRDRGHLSAPGRCGHLPPQTSKRP